MNIKHTDQSPVVISGLQRLKSSMHFGDVKGDAMVSWSRLLIVAILAAALGLAILASASAQTPAPAASSSDALKPEQLEQLVAPIALYPDTLLAEVLMASTYPLEIVQADRWATENKSLKGDALKAAADKQSWDDSVKALVATPSVLNMMSRKLDWTQNIGDAVLAQQPDVMDAIQRLRTKAQKNNKLASTQEQKVSERKESDKQVIVIEPTAPDTIYVPYYDPAVVYGGWDYPAYPPFFFPPPPYIGAGLIRTGLAFGAGYAVGRWASGGNYWGGGIGWGGNNINVNRPININNVSGNRNWQHNPTHRGGVKYRNANVQTKFGNNNIHAGSRDRIDFRGHGGNQVIKPGGDAGGKLANVKPGDRPNAANRQPGNRPNAATRPSTGTKKPAAARPKRDSALGNIQSGKAAHAQSARGKASLKNHGGGGRGGGAARAGGGGAKASAGGGRRGGGGGGGRGRRSDVRLKHDIAFLGRLENGLGFYRFTYNGGHRDYVGVMAQEVQAVQPEAVTTGRDGYLRVFYEKLGLKFETYDSWVAAGARLPKIAGSAPAPSSSR